MLNTGCVISGDISAELISFIVKQEKEEGDFQFHPVIVSLGKMKE